MTFSTTGERLVGRQLMKERRAGVPHFRTGQMAARQSDEDPEVYEVSWVNHMGHACLLYCVESDGEWFAFPIFMQAGQETARQERLPENFAITEGMRAALDRARGVASSDTRP